MSSSAKRTTVQFVPSWENAPLVAILKQSQETLKKMQALLRQIQRQHFFVVLQDANELLSSWAIGHVAHKMLQECLMPMYREGSCKDTVIRLQQRIDRMTKNEEMREGYVSALVTALRILNRTLEQWPDFERRVKESWRMRKGAVSLFDPSHWNDLLTHAKAIGFATDYPVAGPSPTSWYQILEHFDDNSQYHSASKAYIMFLAVSNIQSITVPLLVAWNLFQSRIPQTAFSEYTVTPGGYVDQLRFGLIRLCWNHKKTVVIQLKMRILFWIAKQSIDEDFQWSDSVMEAFVDKGRLRDGAEEDVDKQLSALFDRYSSSVEDMQRAYEQRKLTAVQRFILDEMIIHFTLQYMSLQLNSPNLPPRCILAHSSREKDSRERPNVASTSSLPSKLSSLPQYGNTLGAESSPSESPSPPHGMEASPSLSPLTRTMNDINLKESPEAKEVTWSCSICHWENADESRCCSHCGAKRVIENMDEYINKMSREYEDMRQEFQEEAARKAAKIFPVRLKMGLPTAASSDDARQSRRRGPDEWQRRVAAMSNCVSGDDAASVRPIYRNHAQMFATSTCKVCPIPGPTAQWGAEFVIAVRDAERESLIRSDGEMILWFQQNVRPQIQDEVMMLINYRRVQQLCEQCPNPPPLMNGPTRIRAFLTAIPLAAIPHKEKHTRGGGGSLCKVEPEWWSHSYTPKSPEELVQAEVVEKLRVLKNKEKFKGCRSYRTACAQNCDVGDAFGPFMRDSVLDLTEIPMYLRARPSNRGTTRIPSEVTEKTPFFCWINSRPANRISPADSRKWIITPWGHVVGRQDDVGLGCRTWRMVTWLERGCYEWKQLNVRCVLYPDRWADVDPQFRTDNFWLNGCSKYGRLDLRLNTGWKCPSCGATLTSTRTECPVNTVLGKGKYGNVRVGCGYRLPPPLFNPWEDVHDRQIEVSAEYEKPIRVQWSELKRDPKREQGGRRGRGDKKRRRNQQCGANLSRSQDQRFVEGNSRERQRPKRGRSKRKGLFM